MMNRDQIAKEALALPPEERSYLADVLEQSLTTGEFATQEIAAEWTAEIDRRIAAYDRGEIEAMDAKAALERIRARLARYRQRRTP
jgi:putative addiction module component (TIGR02574 family)